LRRVTQPPFIAGPLVAIPDLFNSQLNLQDNDSINLIVSRIRPH
jgi:hypothetical protein